MEKCYRLSIRHTTIFQTLMGPLLSCGTKVLAQAREELDIKILPGPGVLLDAGNHNLMGLSANLDLVLLARQNDDSHDPQVRKGISLVDCEYMQESHCDRPLDTSELERSPKLFEHGICYYGDSLASHAPVGFRFSVTPI